MFVFWVVLASARPLKSPFSRRARHTGRLVRSATHGSLLHIYICILGICQHVSTYTPPKLFPKKKRKKRNKNIKNKKKLTITPYNIVTYQHRLLNVELGLGWPLCKLIFNIHSIYSHYISTIRKRHGLSIDILLQVWTLNPPKKIKNEKWKKGPILWFFRRYSATREQRSAKKIQRAARKDI